MFLHPRLIDEDRPEQRDEDELDPVQPLPLGGEGLEQGRRGHRAAVDEEAVAGLDAAQGLGRGDAGGPEAHGQWTDPAAEDGIAFDLLGWVSRAAVPGDLRTIAPM